MLFGALAQSLPDIDFVAAFWMGTATNLLAHRGFTHSILFAVIFSFFLAVASEYWHRKHDITLRRWMFFFGVEIGIHLLLDGMNAYGVGWFEPFSHYRVSFHNLFVADPFFSIWSLITLIALLRLGQRDRCKKKWLAFGFSMSALYLLYSFYNKYTVDTGIKASLQKENIQYHSFITTPTPLNNWLWYAVVATDSGYYIGYRSVFDGKSPTTFHYFPRNNHLMLTASNHQEVQQLLRFAQGYYTLENRNDTLLFNVLRFGQVVGWHDPQEKFAFHYYLEHDNNELVVQRGRFARWNKQTIHTLLERIKGNNTNK